MHPRSGPLGTCQWTRTQSTEGAQHGRRRPSAPSSCSPNSPGRTRDGTTRVSSGASFLVIDIWESADAFANFGEVRRPVLDKVDLHPARRLTRESGQAQDDDASWSPDGSHITYLHWIYGSPDQFRIATIRADGSNPQLVTPASLQAADPTYSPDGKLILFQAPPDPQAGVDQELYTVQTNGQGLHRLSRQLAGVAANHASWSRDGRTILFCHIPPGQTHGADLYLINLDGTHLRPLRITPALNENDASWVA